MDLEKAYERAEILPGWFSRDEGRLLWSAAEHAAALGPLVEVGSYRGRSSMFLMGHGAHVFLVEPFFLKEDRAPGDDGTREVGFKYVRRELDFEGLRSLRSNLQDLDEEYTLLPWESKRAADRFEPESLGLVFVDGDHGKGGVDVDAELWLPKLRSGGVAAFHDYGDRDYPLVTESVDSSTTGWKLVGIVGSLIVKEKP